ncbi:MAG: tRNA lysidine(34) synthetase TilS [Eubacteriales bacterium]|nr:tRNA lysidine(34) synthetase TilS [Eubacteriales bacterium]
MYEKVRGYIRENQMLTQGDTVLAGVSGGADSLAMLAMLAEYKKEIKFDIHVIHVNHGIRGEEADGDQRLVEEICREWEIPCDVYRYDVPSLALKWKVGTEEAGRMARKKAFEEEGRKLGKLSGEAGKEHGLKIALAHNRNDLAETMLHNLCRGSGLRGLCSMRPVNGKIIRPVLCLDRKEIEHYLKERGISYAVDSSNLEDAYTRNRIRHKILPLLETDVNPQAIAHMAETARVAAQAEEYLTRKGRELAEKYLCREAVLLSEKESFNLKKSFSLEESFLLGESFFEAEPILISYGVMEIFFRLSGKRKDFTAFHIRQVQSLFGMQTGKRTELPYGLMAKREYGGVRIYRMPPDGHKTEQEAEWEIIIPGTTVCSFGELSAKIFSYQKEKIPQKKYTKWFDYDKIEGNLTVRTRRTGDFLIVNQDGGHKKLNRYMIDEKIPREERDHIPLVAADSQVLWMIGGRINERYKITPGTRRVLELKYQGGYYHE